MVVLGRNNGDGLAADVPRRRWSAIGALWRLSVTAVVIAALAFGLFLWRLPTQELALAPKADGIVVLTGGAARVNDAIDLLASGHGRRLLISGVHPATRAQEISRLNPEHERVVKCCVDLDKDALNTIGNASGARRWAKEQGFRTLIVVTSNYHMPRAMAELSHQLPDVTLIPYPVISATLRTEPWYQSGATMKLVFVEYLKYMLALGRIRLEGVVEADETSALTQRR